MEIPYRLVIQEVPRPEDTGEGAAVAVLLRISIPVFVKPQVPSGALLVWEAARTSDQDVRVTLHNRGNAHTKIRDIELSSADGVQLAKLESFVAYVLPGEKRSWDLTTDVPLPGTHLRLSAGTDDGRVHADLDIEGG